MSLIVIALAAAALTGPSPAQAQECGPAADTTSVNRQMILYPVGYIHERKGNVVTAFIGRGSRDGITMSRGGQARTRAQDRDEGDDIPSERIGWADVLVVTDSITALRATMDDTTSAETILELADLVQVETVVPERDYRGVFFELARNAIMLLDGANEPMWSFDDVMQNESPELEARLVDSLVSQIQDTAVRSRPLLPERPDLDRTLEKGLYRGTKLLDAMDVARSEDVRNFLAYMLSQAEQYMGARWRIDAAYATWLINGTRLSREAMLDKLAAAPDSSSLSAAILEHADQLKEGTYVNVWVNQVRELAESRRFDEAEDRTRILRGVARTLGLDEWMGTIWFYESDIYSEQEDYETAIQLRKRARDNFAQHSDTSGVSASLHGIGTALNSLSRYDESLRVLMDAIDIKRREYASQPTMEIAGRLGNSLAPAGLSLQNLGRFDEAFDLYREADSLLLGSNSPSSLETLVSVRIEMSKTLRKLGRIEEAIRADSAAIRLAKHINNVEGEADALDELGYHFSHLGRDSLALNAYRQARDLHLAACVKGDAGFSMSQMGQVYWRLGAYDQAIESHRASIAIREEVGQRAGQAYSWYKLGGVFGESGDARAALEAYERAADLYQQIEDRSGYADVLESIGDLYEADEEYDTAAEYFNRALAVFEELNALDDVGRTLAQLGDVTFALEQYAEAKDFYERSLTRRTEAGDRAGRVNSLSNLGNLAHFFERDYGRSQEFFDQAIWLAKEIESPDDLAYCYRGRARVNADVGMLEEALEDYRRALEVTESQSERSRTLLSAGYVELGTGRFEDARNLFEEALEVAEASNSRREIGDALSALGELRALVGDAHGSLELLTRALEIGRDVDNPWTVAGAYIGLGNTHNILGNNELAISYYQRADSIYAAEESELARGTPLNNIGTIYYDQAQFDQAMERFTAAYELQTDAGIEDNFTVIILGNIGEVHFEAGRPDEGVGWLERAIDLADRIGVAPSRASAREILARLRMEEEDYDEAEGLLLEAREILTDRGGPYDRGRVLATLGRLYLRKQSYDRADSALTRAVAIARETRLDAALWRPLADLGRLRADQGRSGEAIDMLGRAVDIIEDLRRRVAGGDKAVSSFAGARDRVDVYESLIALLIENGRVDDALAYVERSLSEEIRRQYGQLTVEMADPDATAALEESRDRKARLDLLSAQIDREKAENRGGSRSAKIARLEETRAIAESEYQSFVNTTIREHEELRQHLSNSINPARFTRKKKSIAPDAAVVAYLLGSTRLFTFVATRDTVTARVIPAARDDIDRLVDEVLARSSISPTARSRRGAGRGDRRRKDDELDGYVAELYDILIRPIEGLIRERDKLAIVPSGNLHYLPFQMLLDGGRRLVEEHTIFYLSDLDVFLEDAPTTETHIIAFGNADTSLTNAEIEVNEIARLFPGTQVYVGRDATEGRAKNAPSDFNVLHFATHGRLDYTDFTNSYLALAQDPQADEDGRLTLGEIWSISSLGGYRLVTLSACETAVSDRVDTGWPVNPANAFLSVGVPTVVASLWEVDDEATSLLMQEFYRNLATMGAAAALRTAQTTLAGTPEYADPFFWAPFVLLGDWR